MFHIIFYHLHPIQTLCNRKIGFQRYNSFDTKCVNTKSANETFDIQKNHSYIAEYEWNKTEHSSAQHSTRRIFTKLEKMFAFDCRRKDIFVLWNCFSEIELKKTVNPFTECGIRTKSLVFLEEKKIDFRNNETTSFAVYNEKIKRNN